MRNVFGVIFVKYSVYIQNTAKPWHFAKAKKFHSGFLFSLIIPGALLIQKQWILVKIHVVNSDVYFPLNIRTRDVDALMLTSTLTSIDIVKNTFKYSHIKKGVLPPLTSTRFNYGAVIYSSRGLIPLDILKENASTANWCVRLRTE